MFLGNHIETGLRLSLNNPNAVCNQIISTVFALVCMFDPWIPISRVCMMLADLHFGNYAETVIQLQKHLNALVKPDNKLKVVVVRHGERDCWISLLLVEAEGTNDWLQKHVQIVILSCTWPRDRWKELMNECLAPLSLFVNFVKFQFHQTITS